jgi:hypothetical protein
MILKIYTTLLFFFLTINVFAQNLTQTIRGTVSDADSKQPLSGVSVILVGTDPIVGTTTNDLGQFKLEQVQVNRISLQLIYFGYETITLPDIELNSGKEKVITAEMQESILETEEVVIQTKEKGTPVNDMSLVSTRSISSEESKRFAGGFNDPSKVLTNFAGVTHSQNGQNDIIVRGNSPKYVQWRLEGIEITNPTHFADQNNIKGGISALNNSLLATSDFSTGAFAPEYGNVLSGVIDVKLREGNNRKLESSVGVGILGSDLTFEGPLKKGYDGSFLVNYRYSTISLIKQLGLIKADGVLNYQDAAFKVVLPSKKAGTFSIFGLGGLSGFNAKNVKPDVTTTPSNTTDPADISEDYKKQTYLANIGMNHTLFLTDHSSIKTSLSFTDNGIWENIFKVKTTKIYDDKGNYKKDSVGNDQLYYKSSMAKACYTAAITYNYKLNAKNTLQIGTKYSLWDYHYNLGWLPENSTTWFTAVDMHKFIGTLRNFISWKWRPTEHITIVSGFHNMNVLYNHKSTIEPRVAIKWQLTDHCSIHVGYGKHSMMESIHNYFTRITQKDGSVIEPNKNLGLLKAKHYVVGYEKQIGKNIRATLEFYYQYLYNLPVENLDTSYYATINEGNNYRYVPLVNKGTGKNYGVELTIERFLANNYYFLINGSLYNSKYRALDGIERNTAYNGNYLVNLLCGREFTKLGRKRNQTLTLNGKIFFGGGQKYIPLLRDNAGNISVDPANNQFWNYGQAYNNSLGNIYQLTLSATYKWNKPRATHELYINLDNLTNTQAKLSEYYDPTKPGSVSYIKQFGFFPNLMYRVYF